jgi:hypothetical protein
MNKDDLSRYENGDCSSCTFLGRFEEYDLYFCSQGSFPTVIARYGNGPEYYSGMALAETIAPLREAKRRAMLVGFSCDTK